MIEPELLPKVCAHLPCMGTIIADLNCKLGYYDEDIKMVNLVWQGSRQVRAVRRRERDQVKCSSRKASTLPIPLHNPGYLLVAQ